MLPVYRGCRVFPALSVLNSPKKCCLITLAWLCVLLRLWSSESAIFLREKSETILFKVVPDIASFRNKTQCPKTNFDFFD